MGTFATLGFVGAVAAGAIYLGFRPTVANGARMAERLHEVLADKGVTAVQCPASIPITAAGAAFQCVLETSVGETHHVEFVIDREGDVASNVASERTPSGP
ncbi:MAG: DUF4333 domain-containing protein [Kofleriaceae bacterium]